MNARRTTGVYFIAYPKTGSTWLRFMLGCYLQEAHGLAEPPLFDDYDRLGRAIPVNRLPGIAFTHEPLTWQSQTAGDLTFANTVEPFRGKKIVLIVRYPLDAVLSHWHQMRTQARTPYEGDLVSFTDDPVFGLEKLLRFYSFWEEARSRGFGASPIRYEDIQEDPAGELSRALDAIGVWPVDAGVLKRAAERASFSSMKAMEESGDVPRYSSSGLPIFATGDRSDPNAFHVRQGKVGGYRSEHPAGVVPRFEQRIAEVMGGWYGYDSPPVAERAVPA